MTATARKVLDEKGCAVVAMNTHVCIAICCTCASIPTRAQALVTRMDAAGVPLDRFVFGIVIML
jgi:hypothetical protein